MLGLEVYRSMRYAHRAEESIRKASVVCSESSSTGSNSPVSGHPAPKTSKTSPWHVNPLRGPSATSVLNAIAIRRRRSPGPAASVSTEGPQLQPLTAPPLPLAPLMTGPLPLSPHLHASGSPLAAAPNTTPSLLPIAIDPQSGTGRASGSSPSAPEVASAGASHRLRGIVRLLRLAGPAACPSGHGTSSEWDPSRNRNRAKATPMARGSPLALVQGRTGAGPNVAPGSCASGPIVQRELATTVAVPEASGSLGSSVPVGPMTPSRSHCPQASLASCSGATAPVLDPTSSSGQQSQSRVARARMMMRVAQPAPSSPRQPTTGTSGGNTMDSESASGPGASTMDSESEAGTRTDEVLHVQPHV
jgi:hypothetical protein